MRSRRAFLGSIITAAAGRVLPAQGINLSPMLDLLSGSSSASNRESDSSEYYYLLKLLEYFTSGESASAPDGTILFSTDRIPKAYNLAIQCMKDLLSAAYDERSVYWVDVKSIERMAGEFERKVSSCSDDVLRIVYGNFLEIFDALMEPDDEELGYCTVDNLAPHELIFKMAKDILLERRNPNEVCGEYVRARIASVSDRLATLRARMFSELWLRRVLGHDNEIPMDEALRELKSNNAALEISALMGRPDFFLVTGKYSSSVQSFYELVKRIEGCNDPKKSEIGQETLKEQEELEYLFGRGGSLGIRVVGEERLAGGNMKSLLVAAGPHSRKYLTELAGGCSILTR